MTDLILIGQFYLLLFVLGLVSIPIVSLVFNKFFDRGYGLSKIVTILFTSYFVFLLGTSRLMEFGLFSAIISVLIFACINVLILAKNLSTFQSILKKNKRSFLISELIFLLGFLLWSYVRAHQPDINGLEKFMDYGFIKAILKSDYLPPNDMWAAGETINYYWYGHFISAFLVRLSGVPEAVGYNLMLATIMGLMLSSIFSISATLINTIKKLPIRIPITAGVLSALLVVFAGNFHTPVYVIKEGIDKYWYPDATRFIGHNPETDDKTIHEFPMYSFVVSDLHAHVLSLPLVILILALFANIFINKYVFRDLFWLNTIFISFVMGLVFMTNAWDFGNYLAISTILIFFYVLKNKNLSLKSMALAVFIPVYIVILAILFASPFLAGFESIADGIEIVRSNSPLWQLAILWGFPLVISVCFIVFLVNNHFPKLRNAKSLKKLLNILKPQDLFVLGLIVAGWVLIILPEVFYLKDIYDATHHRANTMFKLTYQAFVIFYLSSGYVIIRTLTFSRDTKRFVYMFIYLVCLIGVFIYPWISTRSYYANLETYKGLSGDSWMVESYPDYYEAINYLESLGETPNILEASGDSYTNYNLVSAFSGLPTVSGWFVHEWLWRGDSSFPQARSDDINVIYSTNDPEIAKRLLDKYEIKYVVVGPNEREKYTVNEELLPMIGSRVFESETVVIYKLDL